MTDVNIKKIVTNITLFLNLKSLCTIEDNIISEDSPTRMLTKEKIIADTHIININLKGNKKFSVTFTFLKMPLINIINPRMDMTIPDHRGKNPAPM